MKKLVCDIRWVDPNGNRMRMTVYRNYHGVLEYSSIRDVDGYFNRYTLPKSVRQAIDYYGGHKIEGDDHTKVADVIVGMFNGDETTLAVYVEIDYQQ